MLVKHARTVGRCTQLVIELVLVADVYSISLKVVALISPERRESVGKNNIVRMIRQWEVKL